MILTIIYYNFLDKNWLSFKRPLLNQWLIGRHGQYDSASDYLDPDVAIELNYERIT